MGYYTFITLNLLEDNRVVSPTFFIGEIIVLVHLVVNNKRAGTRPVGCVSNSKVL